MTFQQFKFYLRANWIKTVCFNFKILPFKDAVKMPILLFGHVDVVCTKRAKCVIKKGGGGLATMTIGNSYSPAYGKMNSHHCWTYISLDGTIVLNGSKQFIGNGCKVSVDNGATLELGDHVFINNQSKIVCKQSVSIGAYTRISWESQIMDTNFHYMVSEEGMVKNKDGRIVIGNHCWIGNRVTVQKGTVLNDYSIVASNSLVNKDFSNIQFGTFGGTPAKLLAKGNIRNFNFAYEFKLNDFFAGHPDVNEVQVNREQCFKFGKDNLDVIPLT